MLTTLLCAGLALLVLGGLLRALAFVLGGLAGLAWGIGETVREHAAYRRLNPDADAPIAIDPAITDPGERQRAYRAEFARRARERNERRVARERAGRAEGASVDPG